MSTVNIRNSLRNLLLWLSIGVGAVPGAYAQGTMVRPKPQSDTTDSSGHRKIENAPKMNDAVVRGGVVLADGTIPHLLVAIYADCAGAQTMVAVADSKGSFVFSPALLDPAKKTNRCTVRGFLDGYRSEARDLTVKPLSDTKVGTVVLRPLGLSASGLASATDLQAGKAQRKDYDKALDEASRGELSNAIALLQKATAAFPGYSSGWFTLGVLQSRKGDLASAEKSLIQSIRADKTFALPLIQQASLEAARGDWRDALDHSQQAIELNALAFPNAFSVNALANMNLQNADTAEKNAREGLKLDTHDQYPELHYVLGNILYGKNDVDGAKEHLQRYVSLSPGGPNADIARNELTQMNAAPAEVAKINTSVALLPGPGSGPTIKSIQDRNTTLLETTPDHTCLETIYRVEKDLRGRLVNPESIRLEIAVSKNEEIYGSVSGKRFSNESLHIILKHTFSSTGLFSSMARALIAGNHAQLEFAGSDELSGELVYRYNFRVLTGGAGWSIQSAKKSGQAGEEGWLLLDRANLVLRRVVVHAVDLPRNLKLKSLEAVIDYEPQTIADRRVLLPSVAEVQAKEIGGTEFVSRMFFNHCRAFVGASSVSFDAEATPSQGVVHPGKLDLPADLTIVVSLASPLSLATVAESDLITALVTQPVMSKGRQIIAAGSSLHGHVRLRRGENSIVLELDRVQTEDGWLPFSARLISLASTQAEPDRAQSSHLRVSADPEIPGVARIYFNTHSAELAAGTQMIWKTESLGLYGNMGTPQVNTSMGLR